MKEKSIKAGQRGEGSDHILGRNVPRMGNVKKEKVDEVSGRQK
jgi:hypothetical protein